jgi:hypothetical protein
MGIPSRKRCDLEANEVQSALVNHVDMWAAAKVRQAEADAEVRRVEAEMWAVKSRACINAQVERDDVGPGELGRLMGSCVDSW